MKPPHDTITVHQVVRLVGAVETHAQVVDRQARSLLVRWHGHVYRATGEAAGPAERERRGIDEGGAPVWTVHRFEPWAVAAPRSRRPRQMAPQKGAA